MANDKARSQQEPTIEVMVARRKSIDVDGTVYGPGAKLRLPVGDAKSLYEKGFIVEPDDDDSGDAAAGTAAGANDGPSIQTDGQES